MSRSETLKRVHDFVDNCDVAEFKKLKCEHTTDIQKSNTMLRSMQDQVAAFGAIKLQCRQIQTHLIKLSHECAANDARLRIKDFILSWNDPKEHIWHYYGRKIHLFVDDARAKFDRICLMSFLQKQTWSDKEIALTLKQKFLCGCMDCIYCESQDRTTTLAVKMFGKNQLRHNKRGYKTSIFPYGVTMVKDDRAYNLMNSRTKDNLLKRMLTPVNVISKYPLRQISGYKNNLKLISAYIADPFAAVHFQAKYIGAYSGY